MADKFLGNARVVEFAGTDISGKYTTFSLDETSPERERVDASDKGSWAAGQTEMLDGLEGEPKNTANVEINDEVGGVSPVYDLAINDTGDLVEYPEGKVHGKPRRTMGSAVLKQRTKTGSYKDRETWKLQFVNYEAIVDDTYSTA